jgi:glycosyl transferase family 25
MQPWTIQSIPAFCITLERRVDRWKRFQDQSGLNGLKVQRFLGIDGRTLDIKNDNRITTLCKRNILAKTRRSHEELNTAGGVGCALSHIAVWQWMVENQQELCLIFEDDCVVPSDFIKRANTCIDKSMILRDPKAWELWLLGGIWEDKSRIPGEFLSDGMVRVGAFVLSHAYVITLPMAKRFLTDVYPIQCHIDFWMSIYAYMHDLRVIGCTTLKLGQNEAVKTDIQTDDICELCNIPTDFAKTHHIVTHRDWTLARGAELICVGLLAYYLIR